MAEQMSRTIDSLDDVNIRPGPEKAISFHSSCNRVPYALSISCIFVSLCMSINALVVTTCSFTTCVPLDMLQQESPSSFCDSYTYIYMYMYPQGSEVALFRESLA